jgi:FtsP/CotA-like multicopper oxidase with cupredoxin domain/fibronectin type 3 domain-containing protein
MADVPLVIQDKTFVPDAATLAATDPLWDTAKWGDQGSLWYPHVYMPNQDPFNSAGATPYGRWDYGPWFWPPTPVAGPMPTISHVPEAFMDTPIVNGTAYPYIDVDPRTYRFRVLNACNDRMLNLQTYIADPNNFAVTDAKKVKRGTEVKMVPADLNPNIPFPTLWQFQTPGMIPDILDGRPGGVPDPAFIGPSMVQIGTEGGLLPAPVVHPNTPVGYEQNKRNIVVGSISEKNLLLAPAERADLIIDFSLYAGKSIILYNDAPAPVPAGDPRNDFYTGNPDFTTSGGHAPTLPGYGPNTRTILQFRVAAAPIAPIFMPRYYAPDPPQVPPAALTTALAAAYTAIMDPPIVDGVTSRIQDNSIPLTPQPLGSIKVTAGGSGYTSAPTVQFLGGLPGTGAAATAVVSGGKVTSITLDTAGSGYSYAPTIMLSGGGGFGATATATVANAQPMLPKTIQELFDPLGRMNSTLGVELPFTTAFVQTTIPLAFIDPVTETLAPNETQIWKITHNGVDTHGIHFHLLNVQVINRVGWDGAIRPADPNELGWRDTVRMNPLEDIIVAAKAKPPVLPFGQPDSIRPLDVTQPLGGTANFSNIDPLTGNAPAVRVSNVMTNFGAEYTWHCHLLGHEENDMMRALVLTTSNVVVPPAFTLNKSTPGSTVTLTWGDPTPITAVYDPKNPGNYGNPANEIGFKIMRAALHGGFVEIAAVPANTTTFVDTFTDTIAKGTVIDPAIYQIVAFNAAGSTASNNIVVTTVPPPAILTSILPDGIVGVAYNQALTEAGGFAPLTWSITSGSLPNGLNLDTATGVISLTPSAAGTFNFTVMVADVFGKTAIPQSLSITVTPPVAISTTALPNGYTGTAYSQTLAGTGAPLPYVWSISAGTLPAGLQLDPGTGIISGTPTVVATTSFTVKVIAGNGSSATQALSIRVQLPPPAAPNGLAVTFSTSTQATLTWNDNSTNETSFAVWRSVNGAAFTRINVARTAAQGLAVGPVSYNNTGVSAANNYAYYVTAVNANGASAPTATVTLTSGLPAAPTNLTATIANATRITLAWTDNATNESNYVVWRSVNGLPATATTIARTAAQMSATGAVTYNDNTVVAGNTYDYYVTAVNASGAVANATVVTVNFAVPAVPVLALPTAVRTTATSTTDTVTLIWTDVATETSYTVQRATDALFTLGLTTTNNIAANTTSTSQARLARGVTYYYRVRAANTVGTSAWSNAQFILTP